MNVGIELTCTRLDSILPINSRLKFKRLPGINYKKFIFIFFIYIGLSKGLSFNTMRSYAQTDFFFLLIFSLLCGILLPLLLSLHSFFTCVFCTFSPIQFNSEMKEINSSVVANIPLFFI